MKRATLSAIVSILLIFCLFFVFRSNVYAENPWFLHSFDSFTNVIQQSEQTQSIEKETFDLASVGNLFNIMNGFLFGFVQNNSNPNSMLDSRNGAIAVADRFVLAIYENPPASTYVFIQDIGHSLGFLPKPVYAQGIGFSGLTPLLGMWKAFRNIAYLLLAVFMIFVGFMIMFRKKIDPKTVVTVQNALPRIVIALLLITFSYAIVGILIDLMYLIMMVVISVLVSASNGVLSPDTPAKYAGGGFWFFAGKFIFGEDLTTTYQRWHSVVELLAGPEGFWSTLKKAIIYFPPVSLVIFLILGVAILVGYVRVLFLLVSSYIQIIMALLIGPFQLLIDAFPGGNGFSSWIKNLIANLSVYPITAIMLVVGSILVNMSTIAPDTSGLKLWTPPLLGSSGSNAQGLLGLIALGILLTIPTIAGSVKEALKAKAPIGVGPGAIFGPVGAGVGQAMQLWYQGSIIKSAWFKTPPPSTPFDRATEAQQKGPGYLQEKAKEG
jgi:hypothetical protein